LATAFTAPTITQQAQLIDAFDTRSPLEAESQMVPSEWSAVDGLPRLSLGNTDRRARPVSALAHEAKSDEASRPTLTAIEARVEEIWRLLLGTDSIDSADNFFDLGGHSLLATQVVSRIKTAFHVDFDLRSFFLAPTIAAVAATVERQMTRRRSAPALMT